MPSQCPCKRKAEGDFILHIRETHRGEGVMQTEEQRLE